MSKTLGNVIDPIDTIKEFGTDALRFTLALGTAVSASCALGWFLTDSNGSLTTNFALLFQDLNLSTERLTSNKAFTNKLWNAGKFVLQNLPSQSDISAWETILACKVCVFAHF
ncbi:Valine--tRNA ligase, chloroplastic/mitochondrial 2 [Vitis vinifera]|uniref:valine--tRNA ligase n=1 Tax=Vitis vinifera TaxID=29760 RepID=A0A438I0A2_VITVI|nr:Valine--tRNA ligase, chloroplastic/mitochondrial 2 [Vitis vinifera]